MTAQRANVGGKTVFSVGDKCFATYQGFCYICHEDGLIAAWDDGEYTQTVCVKCATEIAEHLQSAAK